MKIGVKAYHDPEFIKHFESKADFLEVMAIEGKDYSFLNSYKIPIIIHSMHYLFGVNLSDPKKEEANSKAINFAIELANQTNATKIIVHPGEFTSLECSKETSERFLRRFNDNRIIVENHPNLEVELENDSNLRAEFKKSVFVRPEEISQLIKNAKKGFCFDINHALTQAHKENLDYISFIKEFLKLKPSHFHLGGQKFSPSKSHLDFSDSEINLREILSLLPKNAEITLEVSKDIKKTEADLSLIRDIIGKL